MDATGGSEWTRWQGALNPSVHECGAPFVGDTIGAAMNLDIHFTLGGLLLCAYCVWWQWQLVVGGRV